MAITVKHKFVSAIPDSDDTSVVRPSNWNDDHDLTGTIPVANGGTGASTADGAVTNLLPSQTGNTGKYLTTDGTNTSWSANASGDVVGPASATDNAITRFDGTTGKLIQNSVVTVGDTGQIAGVLQEDFTSTTAPSYLEGRVWYDSTEKALAFYNDSSALAVHVAQDLIVKVINNTGSTIANGSPVYITSTSSGQTYPNVALARADVAATSSVIGLTNGAIPNGSIGYVSAQGLIDNVNTGTFTVGQVLYLSPYSAGQLMNTIPPTGITVQVGVVSFVNSSTGKIYVKQTTPLAVPASIITGVLPVANGGTGVTTSTGSGSNVLNTSPTLTTPAITGGTIDNAVIGGTTPAAGTFTTITGQTEVLRGTGQNYFTNSNGFSTGWSPTFATVSTASAITDPFGGTSTWNLTEDTTTNAHLITKSFTAFSGLPYVTSIYAKANTRNFVVINTFDTTNRRAWFNLSTGAVGTTDAGVTASIQSIGNGWYRCSILTYPTSSSTFPTFAIASADNTYTYLGNGSGIYIYGAQLELSATIGTYTATTTTAIFNSPNLSFSNAATIGLQSDGSLYVSPAGTGALQAQATTSSTVGGNARGANAVDWQTSRGSANQVASSAYATIGGGSNNRSAGSWAVIGGGYSNLVSGNQTLVFGGSTNTASLDLATVGGGFNNTAAGYFNFIGAGYTNSGTSGTAVTTQSATMNATTTVTLAASNASIKVGQLITGTSIANYTYVAAISGTTLTLSVAASGSSTSTLSFYTPHGVVVGGGNNQATGAYSFIGGGGDAGTAANRNVASGDWSVVGGGRANIASGIGSVIAGGGYDGSNLSGNTASAGATFIGSGLGNTANASYAMVLGGTINTSNATSSSVYGGSYGTTRAIVGNTTTSGSFSPLGTFTTGNSQTSLLVLARQTTDATATVLASNSSAAGTTNQVILPNNSAYYFKASIISGVTGGGNSKAWTIEGLIKRGANAASAALVGTPVVNIIAADAGASTWAIAATADTTNGGLAITFTGQASTTIRTVCKVETTEMTY